MISTLLEVASGSVTKYGYLVPAAVTAFGAFVFVIICVQIKHRMLRRKLKHIRDCDYKVLPYWPLLGQGISIPMDPAKMLDMISRLGRYHQEQYPDEDEAILWFTPIHPTVLSIGPKSAEIIFKNKAYNGKHFFYDFLHPWLGTGLLTSNDEKWAKRRRMITPTFHFNILKEFLPIMNNNSKTMVNLLHDQIKASGKKSIELDIFPKITLAALDVISTAAMGIPIHAQTDSDSSYVNAINRTGLLAVRRMIKFWLWPSLGFNFFHGTENTANLKLMHEFVENVIQQRMDERKREKEIGAESTDFVSGKKQVAFLDMLLDNYDIGEIDRSGIREEVDTFMFEGHDTTASAMNFTAHFLGHSPERQLRAQEEIDETVPMPENSKDFKKRVEAFDIESEHLPKFQFLDAVGRETLRLLPSVTFLGRQSPLDSFIGLAVFMNIINTDPRQWKDPDTFKPERFLDDSLKHHPYAYVPFSAGFRNCVGQRFATMEMKVVTAYLFKFFNVESLDKTEDLELQPNLIVRPNRGVRVRLSLRETVE